MPVIIVLAALAGAAVFALVMLPLSIALRFRAGSTRRRAWGWLITLNLFAALLSAAILLATAAISGVWIPNAFRYTLIGMACGVVLGGAGLLLSRWESSPAGLHYTPSRWLILLITVIATSRILYGFWRAWHSWQTTPAGESWIAASGAAGSMAAGAAILGYYVVYWAGVHRRVRKHRAAWL